MYGGRPSDMNNMIPKANFGQTIGSVGDTDIAKNLDMVAPGLGTGVDAALDLAGFFGDKKEYKDAKENAGEASAYIQAINSGPNKGNLNFSESISGAEATQNKFMNMEQPNFFKDFVAPTAMSVASSAAGGGLGDMNNILPKNLRSSESLLNTVAGEGGGANKAASILANRSSTEDGTGLMMEDVWSAGIQGPARPDGTYAMGGNPQSDIYEAEGNEVIQHDPGAPPGTTGTMEPIGNNPMLSELKGKSHASGGELVDASGQQIVYSTKLKSKTWGLSFADAAKKIGLKIESFEKAAADGDHITKQTAQSMIQSWTVKLQELQVEQDSARKEKFTKLLQDGSSFEELSQNFPDLTKQFMEAQSKQPAQESMAPTEQEFLYGGMPKRMYGTRKKYEYGSPIDPNDPPFYEGKRTDEEVPANQATFLDYKGNNIYGEDQGIKDYINSIGMEEFANQWMSNMDPELLEFAGINNFDDLFADNGEKLKVLQTLYNEKNAGQPGFTPIPVDKGAGKFGEHSMSMAGWKELEDAATNPGPVNPDEESDPPSTDINDIELGDITDPLADDDGIQEEEEEINILPDPNMGPERGPRDDMAPTATGDPLQDRGYQIQPDPELEFEELDIEDDIEEDEEIVYGEDGSIIYDPNAGRPQENAITLPKVEPGELTLKDYQGVKLPPNNQKNKKKTPPYMGDAPYNDIVADNAGVDLQGPPEDAITLDPVEFEGFPNVEQELMRPQENPITLDPIEFEGFPNKQGELMKNQKVELDNNIIEEEKNLNNDKLPNKDKTKSFNNQKYFNNLAKYMSPLYNLMKSKEGAEIESKKVNPYDNQILQDMDQKVDIQPWLNQNMMAMKGGMDFSKDFASGNPMQMFSMYNRLNQGKMMNDSAAWKYKHDSEGKLKTARANMMYNLGERDRGEDVRVSGVNSQNRAAVDKYVSTAIEQLSAIGQLDEYTANLMENDKLRASFINAMAPDLEKYMKSNPEKGVNEAITDVTSGLTAEQIQAMINKSVSDIPININITPGNNNTSNNVDNNNVEPVSNAADVNPANVLSGNDNFQNPLDTATSNVNTINVADDARFNDAYDVNVNGDLFTAVDGESNKYTYNNKTYVKINQGESELFIEEAEAIEKGLLEDTNSTINNPTAVVNDYTPVISADQMTSLEAMSIQSTGNGAANILENGQPIEVEIDGGSLKVNGVRAEGDKIVVDGSMSMAGVDIPATRDFGEFIQDSNSPSGFKWVPNSNSWQQFQDNASAEQKAMFDSFIQAVEGDVRYAEALRNQISGGSGDMSGSQLNDTIRNKPE